MKVLIIENNLEKSNQISENLKEFFELEDIRVFDSLEHIDLNEYEDYTFITHSDEDAKNLKNKLGDTETKFFAYFGNEEEKVYCIKKNFSTINQQSQHAIDCLIDEVFMALNLRRNLTGALYLKAAIELAVREPEVLIRGITKKLYPDLAKRFNTTSTKIERAIRHAIDTCYNNNKFVALNELFNLKIFEPNDKPSNGEFIALIADKVKLNRNRETFIRKRNYF